MAYTKILPIRTPNHLKRAADYAMNEAKTIERDYDRLDALNDYVQDGGKTDGQRYVSAINCLTETAGAEMMATKKKFRKEGGRLGYQVIQSFAPGEVEPGLAHRIGVEYAERWLGDFEVVIGTHLDRGHIHNHIIFNSVACARGYKFHMSIGEFYEKLYGISNELCREHGLSVIQQADDRHMTYQEWQARQGSGKSIKEVAREDVERCMEDSFSMGEVYTRLENLGYEVNINGVHPKIRVLGQERFMRIDTLMKWSIADLAERVDGKTITRDTYRPPEIKRGPYFYQRCAQMPKFKPHKITRFEAMYLRWLYILGKAKKYPKRYPVSVSEYRKFNLHKQQLQFIAKNGISKASQAVEKLAETERQIKALDVARFKLLGAKKKNKALFEAAATVQRLELIVAKLEPEQRKQYEVAVKLLDSKGYGKKLDQLEEMRTSIMNGILENKEKVSRLKGDKKMIEGILANSAKIREAVKKEYARPERTQSIKGRLAFLDSALQRSAKPYAERGGR